MVTGNRTQGGVEQHIKQSDLLKTRLLKSIVSHYTDYKYLQKLIVPYPSVQSVTHFMSLAVQWIMDNSQLTAFVLFFLNTGGLSPFSVD